MFAFAPCGCGSTICAVALGRESVESGCPAAVCLDGWLAGGRRPVKAVPVVYSRFAALWGTFRLSTPSEGVQGYIRGLLRSVAHSGFLLLPKESGFRLFSLLLPKECRGTFAVCLALWPFPAFHSFRRGRVFGRFRYSFRRSEGKCAYIRNAARSAVRMSGAPGWKPTGGSD